MRSRLVKAVSLEGPRVILMLEQRAVNKLWRHLACFEIHDLKYSGSGRRPISDAADAGKSAFPYVRHSAWTHEVGNQNPSSADEAKIPLGVPILVKTLCTSVPI